MRSGRTRLSVRRPGIGPQIEFWTADRTRLFNPEFAIFGTHGEAAASENEAFAAMACSKTCGLMVTNRARSVPHGGDLATRGFHSVRTDDGPRTTGCVSDFQRANADFGELSRVGMQRGCSLANRRADFSNDSWPGARMPCVETNMRKAAGICITSSFLRRVTAARPPHRFPEWRI